MCQKETVVELLYCKGYIWGPHAITRHCDHAFSEMFRKDGGRALDDPRPQVRLATATYWYTVSRYVAVTCFYSGLSALVSALTTRLESSTANGKYNIWEHLPASKT